MSETKISALTALAEAPANDDDFPMNDISAGPTTKRNAAGYLRRFAVSVVVASNSLALNAKHLVTLNLGTAIALTISTTPVAGDEVRIVRKGSGAVTHTVQLPSGVTWDGTNRTANFDTDGDAITAVAESATRFIVHPNNGVTFTA